MTDKKLSAIQKAQQHYQSKLTGDLKHYRCEEWELDVYYRDITTLKQEAKIVEYAQQNKSIEALVETIIQKSLDKDGKPLFNQFDKPALMNEADPVVVMHIARVLNNVVVPTLDEVEKN